MTTTPNTSSVQLKFGTSGFGATGKNMKVNRTNSKDNALQEESIMSVKACDDVLSACSNSRQVAEQSELMPKAETRGQHWCASDAAPRHAPDAQHIAGVDGRIAKRSEGEERHRRSEDDHA